MRLATHRTCMLLWSALLACLLACLPPSIFIWSKAPHSTAQSNMYYCIIHLQIEFNFRGGNLIHEPAFPPIEAGAPSEQCRIGQAVASHPPSTVSTISRHVRRFYRRATEVRNRCKHGHSQNDNARPAEPVWYRKRRHGVHSSARSRPRNRHGSWKKRQLASHYRLSCIVGFSFGPHRNTSNIRPFRYAPCYSRRHPRYCRAPPSKLPSTSRLVSLMALRRERISVAMSCDTVHNLFHALAVAGRSWTIVVDLAARSGLLLRRLGAAGLTGPALPVNLELRLGATQWHNKAKRKIYYMSLAKWLCLLCFQKSRWMTRLFGRLVVS
jgi:hypothetical protein